MAVNFGDNFNIGANKPIDQRHIVSTISQLTSGLVDFTHPLFYAYKGMIVTVLDDGFGFTRTYRLNSAKEQRNNINNWIEMVTIEDIVIGSLSDFDIVNVSEGDVLVFTGYSTSGVWQNRGPLLESITKNGTLEFVFTDGSVLNIDAAEGQSGVVEIATQSQFDNYELYGTSGAILVPSAKMVREGLFEQDRLISPPPTTPIDPRGGSGYYAYDSQFIYFAMPYSGTEGTSAHLWKRTAFELWQSVPQGDSGYFNGVTILEDSDDMPEGISNLYFTEQRVFDFLSGGTAIDLSTSGVISFDGSTTNVIEGNNLYFTEERARNTLYGTNGVNYNANTGVFELGGAISKFIEIPILGDNNGIDIISESGNNGINVYIEDGDDGAILQLTPNFVELFGSTTNKVSSLLINNQRTRLNFKDDNLLEEFQLNLESSPTRMDAYFADLRTTNRVGIQYTNFGEASIIDDTGVDYSSLTFNSLVPAKWVQDEIANSTPSLLGTNGVDYDNGVISLTNSPFTEGSIPFFDVNSNLTENINLTWSSGSNTLNTRNIIIDNTGDTDFTSQSFKIFNTVNNLTYGSASNGQSIMRMYGGTANAMQFEIDTRSTGRVYSVLPLEIKNTGIFDTELRIKSPLNSNTYIYLSTTDFAEAPLIDIILNNVRNVRFDGRVGEDSFINNNLLLGDNTINGATERLDVRGSMALYSTSTPTAKIDGVALYSANSNSLDGFNTLFIRTENNIIIDTLALYKQANTQEDKVIITKDIDTTAIIPYVGVVYFNSTITNTFKYDLDDIDSLGVPSVRVKSTGFGYVTADTYADFVAWANGSANLTSANSDLASGTLNVPSSTTFWNLRTGTPTFDVSVGSGEVVTMIVISSKVAL